MNQASAKLLLAVLFSASMVSLLNLICRARIAGLRMVDNLLCFSLLHGKLCSSAQRLLSAATYTGVHLRARYDSEHTTASPPPRCRR